jgi:hypothetical protein
MERAVYYSKSFIIALAMTKHRLNAEEAAQAALVEVQSQIQRWGEVEDSKSPQVFFVAAPGARGTLLIISLKRMTWIIGTCGGS